MGKQLWQGRTTGQVEDIMIRMGESISLDIELYLEDLKGSAEHARMLARCGIITDDDMTAILEGLRTIRTEIESGKMPLQPELEDIHTHIETRLKELIGEPAGRLHTARSRNDQIAVDTHLYVKRKSAELRSAVMDLCEALLEQARRNVDVIIPSYTHMQVAQPVRFSHHLLAYFWMFLRDVDRYTQAYHSADSLPLGSGAATGVNYQTDREFLQTALDFGRMYENSMDAVSSRDHILDYLYAGSMFSVHASRLAEEIILFTGVEFGFLELPDTLTTGSSIMPQKKNPDLAELTRGKAGRVSSLLFQLLMTVKGLPLTYNRDLQEDRFPLLDSARQCLMIAEALKAMVSQFTVHPERITRSLAKGYATATDLADALVLKKGIPFREAHHITGRLVGLCAEKGLTLDEASIELRSSVHEALADESFYREATALETGVERKVSRGGTARFRVMEQLDRAAAELENRKMISVVAPSLDF